MNEIEKSVSLETFGGQTITIKIEHLERYNVDLCKLIVDNDACATISKSELLKLIKMAEKLYIETY